MISGPGPFLVHFDLVFWDSSAILPLLVTVPPSQAMQRLLAGDDQPVASCGTLISGPAVDVLLY